MTKTASQLQGEIDRYLEGSKRTSKMAADEALNELESQELMSAPHVFTRTDKQLVEIIEKQVASGVEPNWDGFPAGTRRYRFFMERIRRR